MSIFINSPNGTLLVQSCPTMVELKERINNSWGIPQQLQKYHRGGLPLNDKHIFDSVGMQFITLYLACSGGKGGFGSLLRNEAQTRRKVTNWDQSREGDGRRIGHANNEKQLIEFFRQRKQEREQAPPKTDAPKEKVSKKLEKSYVESLKRNDKTIEKSVNQAKQIKLKKEMSKNQKIREILDQLIDEY